MMILLLGLLAVVIAFLAWLFLFFAFSPTTGAAARGERLARMKASPAYRDGLFQNPVPTEMRMPPAVMGRVMWEMLKGHPDREPRTPLPNVALDKTAWERTPNAGLVLNWLGHSTVLLKIDGTTFLTDPVFGKRASSFRFAGPKRFPYAHPIAPEQLPHVDVVLLSHDHYDHLDRSTIVRLKDKRFIVPLGVGAHLERWGVPASSITECDLWDTATAGGVTLTLAPSRHFSGRGLTNRFSTLWGSWALRGRTTNVYFGADSGYSPVFKEVGERLGPFDLALLECGAYNAYWANIHMFPEETAQAARDAQARVLMPIHWGKFSLALHPWKEPVQRLSARTAELGVPLLTPRIGRIVIGADPAQSEQWWDTVV